MKVTLCIALFSCIQQIIGAAPPLVQVLSEPTTNFKPCQDDAYLTCQKVKVLFRNFLSSSQLRFPGGKDMTKASTDMKGGSDKMYSVMYTNSDMSSATLTYDRSMGYEVMSGSINCQSGKKFVIENCGRNCHILVEMKQVKDVCPDMEGSARQMTPMDDRADMNVTNRQATPVISAVFYYNPDLWVGIDVTARINNMVAETNMGYQNTQVDVALSVHCIVPVDIAENPTDSSQRLTDIQNARAGSPGGVLNSADLAVFITRSNVAVNGGSICGQVNLIDPNLSGQPPVTWVGTCSTFVLGHEIGHLLGARHDNDPSGTFNHGFQINQLEMRTIMGTFGSGFTRINYFSSPDLSVNNVAIGTAARNDNRRQITNVRNRISSIGSENLSCDEMGGNCVDTRPFLCRLLARFGICNSGFFATFLSRNCRLSCGFCRP